MNWTFFEFDSAWWPFVFIFLAGALPTDIWRWLGVAFAGQLRDDSEWVLLARSIANALVAGVIARLILFPSGALADIEIWIRLVSVGLAAFVFFGIKRNLLLGVLTGGSSLILLSYFSGYLGVLQ